MWTSSSLIRDPSLLVVSLRQAMSSRGFEDLPVGTKLVSSTYLVTAAAIKAFAREFDPQLFHLEEESAGRTMFGKLAASGWHTAALSMRLFVDTMNVPGGIIGMGVDELRWPVAVFDGDELKVEIEILGARVSKSRPGFGIIRIRNFTKNQRDEVVQSFTASAMVAKRTGFQAGN
jgi:acyl dehydratase